MGIESDIYESGNRTCSRTFTCQSNFLEALMMQPYIESIGTQRTKEVMFSTGHILSSLKITSRALSAVEPEPANMRGLGLLGRASKRVESRKMP